jgi:hypothetical protein
MLDGAPIAEVRGPEAFHLLQALNTGHLGSMTTIHANNAERALTRLADCVLTANVGLPHRSTREATTLAIHLVIHLARLDSRRVVTEVVEVRDCIRGVIGSLSKPGLLHRRSRKERPRDQTREAHDRDSCRSPRSRTAAVRAHRPDRHAPRLS